MSFFHEHLTLLNFYYVVRLLRNTFTMQKAYYGIKIISKGPQKPEICQISTIERLFLISNKIMDFSA